MPRAARTANWVADQLHVFNPVLYLYTKLMPLLITPLYNAFGVPGLVALPWVTLSLEKVAYDTFTAARGHDMYTAAQESGENPHGEFPSGGAKLPSFSLIAVRGEEDRLIIQLLGDEPRKAPSAVVAAVTSS